MACPHLDRHLEDRILTLDSVRDAVPFYRWIKRRRLQNRVNAMFDILYAVRRSLGASE
jgi:hypothetical protein